MNIPAAISIAAGALAIYVGMVARRYARAPGWGEQRWFGLIAYGAAAYALGNVATSMGWSPWAVTVLSRLQLAACLVQLWAWFRYVDAFTVRRPSTLERAALAGVLAAAALCLVPGTVYGGQTATRQVAIFGTQYVEAVPTGLGELVFVGALGAALLVLGRLVSAWRRGREGAGQVALAFSAITIFGVNDALAASGVLPLPYLLDVGFMIPVGAVAWGVTRRFVADAEALHGLRARLESLVDERTRELAKAEEALHQAEKLASLGQFAAGVAHEVNNPASVVTANLRYLSETAAEDHAPPEAQASILESLEAMQRINTLVRRLVDAGRMAAAPSTAGASAASSVAEQAVAEARARTGDRVAYAMRLLPGAQVQVRAEVLHQILSALLLNAGDAIPASRRGRVELVAERTESDRLRFSVSDDGAGMSPEVARRAFDPFFTTKGEGQGSGLGLSVARALAESHGGELRLESREGRGTLAVLELPEAAPP
jgi:signal transduction histidine kinase